MADKEIAMLPATDGVTDDTIIPVYQPGALEPAQHMTGAQFREFGKNAGVELMKEVGDQYAEAFSAQLETAEAAVRSAQTQAELAKGYAEEAKKPIAENSITPNLTTFFKKSVTYGNLYDKDNAEAGYVRCTTGTFTSSSLHWTCPAFPVTPGKNYYVGPVNGTQGQDMQYADDYALYDKDMNALPQSVPSGMGAWNPIPEGVAYMRVSVLYGTGRNACMVVEGTEAPHTYVSYQDGMSLDMGWKDDEMREAILDDAKEYMEENLPIDGAKIAAKSIPITAHDSVIEYNLNLVNPDEVETGKRLDDSTGAVIANEYTDVTGYIPVKVDRRYYFSFGITAVWFYDQDKKPVQKLAWTSAANLLAGLEVPADGFIRVTHGTGYNLAVNDYGMNYIPAEYGTKKLVYTDENGTVFPEAVNDAGIVSAFEWKKVNLADENKKISGNCTNGVFGTVDYGGNTLGYIVDVTPGTNYVFKGYNGNAITIVQYNENWEFVSEVTVSVDSSIGYVSFRYIPSDGVYHAIVRCKGFFAEESEASLNIMRVFYTSNADHATDADGLAIKYAPTDMAEYIRQFAAKTILRDQSKLLQQTIHKTNGLKWNCLGDSLTTLSWGTNMYNIVSDALGLTPNNYGIVSSTIADYENDGATGDPMCVRYTQMDTDADIVTVMGGTNDYARDDKVGTMADRDKTTLYGACHVLFSGLIEKYPNARIAVILPPQNGQGVPSYVETQGGDPDMANMRKKVGIIREVAEYYSLPVCDLFNHGGIPGILPSTIGRLLSGDYLHITPEGYKVLSRQLLPFMRNLIG